MSRKRPLSVQFSPPERKPAGLSEEECGAALALRARRFSALAIAKALGRSEPQVAGFLMSVEGL